MVFGCHRYRKERVIYAARSDELIAQEQGERVSMQSVSH